MKAFTVYIKEKGDILEDAEYISEGFSWLAFIFNFFWLIYNKLWLQGFVYFVILVVIQELTRSGVIQESMQLIFQLGLMIYIGFAGRDFIRKRLDKDGYKFVEVVLANSLDEAEYKFINSLVNESEKQSNEQRESKTDS
jgi:hypothetical protein